MMANRTLLVILVLISLIYNVRTQEEEPVTQEPVPDTSTTTRPPTTETTTTEAITTSKITPAAVGIIGGPSIVPSTTEAPPPSARGNDVLDSLAWVGGWILTVGLYSGRQERPWRRRGDQMLEDLPKIYIPNELTGSELNRAMKLTTQAQAVVEENEFSDWLSFHIRRKNNESNVGPYEPHYYVDEDCDGAFVLSEGFINDTQVELRANGIDEEIIDIVANIFESVRWPYPRTTAFQGLFGNAEELYNDVMYVLQNRNIVKPSADGLSYTLTKKASDLINVALNTTVLHPCNFRYCNWNSDYYVFRDYQDFLKQWEDVINTSAAIIHLPKQISWSGPGGIKQAIQATYKEGIPKVHLYQFLTKTLDYLEIDTAVKGMSKLSPSLTQGLVDSMWHLFGRIHPITNSG